MRKQGRLGRTGGAGGKDNQRAIVLGDSGVEPVHGHRGVRILGGSNRPIGNRGIGERA